MAIQPLTKCIYTGADFGTVLQVCTTNDYSATRPIANLTLQFHDRARVAGINSGFIANFARPQSYVRGAGIALDGDGAAFGHVWASHFRLREGDEGALLAHVDDAAKPSRFGVIDERDET